MVLGRKNVAASTGKQALDSSCPVLRNPVSSAGLADVPITREERVGIKHPQATFVA